MDKLAYAFDPDSAFFSYSKKSGSHGGKLTLLSRLGYAPSKSKSPITVKSVIDSANISVVIPVKNNKSGVERFLATLVDVTPEQHLPTEIIIVDNNSSPPLTLERQYPVIVRVVSCLVPGPAAARNFGVAEAKGNWILFTDSDCVPTATTICGYSDDRKEYIGYAGYVNALSDSTVSAYYQSQEILLPPEAIQDLAKMPDYLVTANCLVYREAFISVGGFDEAFREAGGEDIDLAFRLREVGELQYQFNSIVEHEFSNNIIDFAKRFIRYGSGNKRISKKYGLKLTPRPFFPIRRNLKNHLLSFLQFAFMSYGYHFGKQTENQMLLPNKTLNL